MGLRHYLKINKILSKLNSLYGKIEQSNIIEINKNIKFIDDKINVILSNRIEQNSIIEINKNIECINDKIGIMTSSKTVKNHLGESLSGELDKIYNRISALDNNINKKDYVINDDRLDIIKNLIKDERAQNVVLNMDFEGVDLSLRIDDSDIRVFKQIFVDNEYDSLNLPDTAETIVDLGANIGLSALFFLKKYPDARIVAVEPDAVNFEIMKKNLDRFSKSVAFLQAAIWPTDGEVSLVEEDVNHSSLGAWGYRTEAQSENASVSVKSVSIPTIKQQYNMDFIDILKVDIEGAEYELFEKDYENWIDQVGMIVIETHDRFKPNSEAMVRNAIKDRFIELPMKGENLFFKKK